ncbi:MAG TPA: FmdB family zinc ribbon protein [Acidobacteriota bacterium]|nr:FmdB family zinc ribbon protein [Acidobacteriota bacterium]
MPIYEYKCAKCGEVFEAFQRINDKPLSLCKFCKGPVEKLISHSSFQLKGDGWYMTDYARKSQPSGSAESSTKKAEKSEKSADTGASTASKSEKSD